MIITIDELVLDPEYYLSLVQDIPIKIRKDDKIIAILKKPENSHYQYGDELLGFLSGNITLEEAKYERLIKKQVKN